MNAPGTPVRFSIPPSIRSCPTLNELQHEPKLRDECGEVARVTGEGDEDIPSHVIDRARRATDPSGMTNGPYARISVLRPQKRGKHHTPQPTPQHPPPPTSH